jgi:1,4-alpha-glucan branching enzyme
MPGDDAAQFANVRLLYALMWAHPGKKLLFAGGEFAQRGEWRAAASLDWHLTHGRHAGVAQLVRDCNRHLTTIAALHERDAERDGFAWVTYDDRSNAVVAFLRWDAARDGHVLCICNFSGRPLDRYVVGVPRLTRYHEILNTDATAYGGLGGGNFGSVTAHEAPSHGYPYSVTVHLPALSALWFAP